ncbi:hypothetical protein ACFYRK_38945 [Streptomyces sp. NPDC005381]|uniref:hypothetical protein n=1 Tax=Streptomyces sp. NPDC005381 TaxID=3364714 RepID=UPI003695C2DD
MRIHRLVHLYKPSRAGLRGRIVSGVAVLLLIAAGPASATDWGHTAQPDPNAAPSSRPAAGPEVKSAAAAGSRPVSGKSPTAAPSKKKDAAGFQRVISQKIQLKNTVTDADGDKVNLTFEVWTADAAGNPKAKVKIDDNEYGVIVSPFVASGSTVTVDVPAGKLALNTNYVFHPRPSTARCMRRPGRRGRDSVWNCRST